MSLRLAFLGACPYPVPQGSQVLLRDTALAMRARGHEVCLVTYGHGLGEDPAGLEICRCRRIPGDTRTDAGPSPVKPFLDLALAATLRRVVRERRIEVVHAHNIEALLVALLARVRPVVYHPHNVLGDELPYYFGGSPLAARAGAWLDRLLPRRADAVNALHRRMAGHLVLCGCDPRRVRVIPPPLDAAPFGVPEPAEGMPPVLYAGNLDAYQNLGLLYRAMTRVRRQIPGARLVVATAQAGETPGAERIHTPDFETLRAVLARESVFAVPRVSWSGFPMKLLNAMAAGQAVVACAGAAYPLVDGQTGLIVPDGNEAAFADALTRLLTNPRLRADLGRAAHEAVLQRHAPEVLATRLEALDIELLQNRDGAPRPATHPVTGSEDT